MPVTAVQERYAITAQDFDRPVLCPAGERIGETAQGPACRCRIAQETITAATNPSSLRAYCMADWRGCPIWRDAREREWENRKKLADDHEEPGRTLDLESVPISNTVPADPEEPVRSAA
jgi:hypothetical protein